PEKSRLAAHIDRIRRVYSSYKRWIPAQRVEVSEIQLASLEPPLPPHDSLFNASEAIKLADLTFSLRGRLAEVKIPAEVSLAHWTGPFPIRAHGVPNVYTLHDVIPLQ